MVNSKNGGKVLLDDMNLVTVSGDVLPNEGLPSEIIRKGVEVTLKRIKNVNAMKLEWIRVEAWKSIIGGRGGR